MAEGPTSVVIRDVAPWYNKSILIPHEALRRLMALLEEAVAEANGLEQAKYAWKVRTLFAWLKVYFVPVIHHHHHAEEVIFFPFLRTKAQLPPKVAEDHKQLMERLDGLAAFEKRLLDADDAARAQAALEFRQAVAALCESMRGHLAEEEEVVPPALRDHFTKKEEDAQIQKIIKDLGLKGNAVFLPVIIDCMRSWGGEAEVAAFRASLPPPVRFLHDKSWHKDYLAKNLGAIRSLAGDTEPAPPKSSCALM